MRYVVDSVVNPNPGVVDNIKEISVKLEGVPPAPPVWLIIPVGIVFVGLFYLVTRK